MLSVLQNSNCFTNVLPAILFVKPAILPEYVHLPFILFKSEFLVFNSKPVYLFNRPVIHIVSYLTTLYIFLYTANKHFNSPLIVEPAGA